MIPPCLAVDPSRRLHLAWDSGGAVWYARFDAGKEGWRQRIGGSNSWVGADGDRPKGLIPQARLGDLAATDRGVWLAAVRTTADGESIISLARIAGRWEFKDLARGKGYGPPVFHVQPDETAHLTWADNRGRVFYQRYRAGEPADAQIIRAGGWVNNGRNPVIVAGGGQVLIAYETLYAEIAFALHDGGGWRTGYVTRSGSRSDFDPRFGSDVLHSPQLAVDAHRPPPRSTAASSGRSRPTSPGSTFASCSPNKPP